MPRDARFVLMGYLFFHDSLHNERLMGLCWNVLVLTSVTLVSGFDWYIVSEVSYPDFWWKVSKFYYVERIKARNVDPGNVALSWAESQLALSDLRYWFVISSDSSGNVTTTICRHPQNTRKPEILNPFHLIIILTLSDGKLGHWNIV